MKEILTLARPKERARHVAFEGLDEPAGKAKIKFIRSIPFEKAMGTTMVAYEMNGEPPRWSMVSRCELWRSGGWGANCAKWLSKIVLLEHPFEGHYMDRVYRVFQKGQDPKTGRVVTQIPLKSFFTQPLRGQAKAGTKRFLGGGLGGERELAEIEISADGGRSWAKGEWIRPQERFAWRQWQYVWEAPGPGDFRLLARVTDSRGEIQPMQATWNVLGYENNGVIEHSILVRVE